MSTASWTSVTRDRIREVQDGLLAMAAWAKDSNADPEAMDLLLDPYRDLVEALYQSDMPLAKLVDTSDLLLHVHGSAASGPSPKVSFLARLLTRTRDQVTGLAKEDCGGNSSSSAPVPGYVVRCSCGRESIYRLLSR
jgi:hypothetical protein